MKQYLDLGKELVEKYDRLQAFRPDRTNTGTVSIFGRQIRFNLQEGLPLVTTKKVFLRGIIEELLWFLSGDTNNNTLVRKNVHIWDSWALPNGELGPVYGKQWRSWPNPRGRALVKKDIQERLAIAYHRVDMNEDNDYAYPVSFTRDQLDNLARVYGLCKDHPQVVPVIHETLNSWGIPGDQIIENPIDQITKLIKDLKERPYSRRHIVSTWNVADLPDESLTPQQNAQLGRMALAPCHAFFQFYVEDMAPAEIVSRLAQDGKRYSEYLNFTNSSVKWDSDVTKKWCEDNGIPTQKLSCQLYQRSADYCLGVPFNIASYALLTMMVAQCVNMVPDEFIHTFGDLHIYSNHVEKFKTEQLTREPLPLPTMKISPAVKNIFEFKYEDFELVDYQSHPRIDYGGPAV